MNILLKLSLASIDHLGDKGCKDMSMECDNNTHQTLYLIYALNIIEHVPLTYPLLMDISENVRLFHFKDN